MKILAGKLEYIGIVSVPVLWFIFALEYTGRTDWLTPASRFASAIRVAVSFEVSNLTFDATFLTILFFLIAVILGVRVREMEK